MFSYCSVLHSEFSNGHCVSWFKGLVRYKWGKSDRGDADLLLL